MTDSATRLQLVSSLTYYLGWLSALCGAAVHFGLGAGMFRSMDLPQRNLFEGSVLLFLISTASVVRAGAASKPS